MPDTERTSRSHDASAVSIGRNLVVLSGPSGSGKTTVGRAMPGRMDILISTSATTRQPRPGETDGTDYWFITPEEFKKRAAEGRFVEWAEVFGHSYGTPVEELERAAKQGKRLLLEIDVQGGIQIKKKFPEALAILLLPPDDRSLRERLSRRGTESPADVERRFANAREEVRMAREARVYDVEVVNDRLADTIDQLVTLLGIDRDSAQGQTDSSK
ncbi:MAG: guanylate kinase [Acidobacteria bacterium]|nr:guanylate kinase [Planctomycetota bacterium]MBE3132304.1 guanylate kinase [Acidobacteriota bacterium]